MKQEWRYEIRRASTLVGGETRSFRPTFRDKFILFHVHDILRKGIDHSLVEATRGRHDSTLVSFQHPGLRIVVVRLCPNVYHSSEYV